MVKERLRKGGMNMNPEKRPCFFKIIYDGVTTQHLRIPPKFVKYISAEVLDRAILKGPSSDHWNVEVCKNECGMYLKDGWPCFLNDHSLWNNEFLIFTYDGNMHFNVQIFDKNGCERDDVPVINSRQDSAFSNGKRKAGRPRKNPVGKGKRKVGRPRKIPVGSLHDHQSNPYKNGPGRSMCFLRRRTPNEEEREKVLEATESFTSKFPYFKTSLTPSSAQKGFILPIPASFARANLPTSRTKFILQDPKGRAWKVICIYNGQRYAFSGGWGAFIRGNKLKVGDICVFELVDKDKMQVHSYWSGKRA